MEAIFDVRGKRFRMLVSRTLLTGTNLNRFTLEGEWKGIPSPILEVTLDEDSVTTRLINPLTGEVIDELDSIGFSTVSPRHDCAALVKEIK